MLTQSQLKQTFAQYNFRPLKRYGENYLIDANIKDKIIGAMELSKHDKVLEIGPGLGALTMDLARTGAKVYAVEKDPKAFAILKGLAGENYPNLHISRGDILDFDIGKTSGKKKIKVAGNLPYYITTPIIEKLIKDRSRISFAILMVQREVANRLLASSGAREYSALSCFVQYYTRPSYVRTVKRTSFYPAPKVDSSIIQLTMPDTPSVKVGDEELFFRIIRGAFGQRRKTFLNSLSRKEVLDMPKKELSGILAKIGIDPLCRPETLDLSDFARLANSISMW